MNISVRLLDYSNHQDAKYLIALLNEYAIDPMGGGAPLSDNTKANLVNALAKITGAFSVIAFVDEQAVGLINCFEGFSTFKCKPLINIHDVVVLKAFRGLGLSTKMMQLVEQVAKQRNACKLTLEVLEGNIVAKASYQKYGFVGYELDPTMGKATFWEKTIS